MQYNQYIIYMSTSVGLYLCNGYNTIQCNQYIMYMSTSVGLSLCNGHNTIQYRYVNHSRGVLQPVSLELVPRKVQQGHAPPPVAGRRLTQDTGLYTPVEASGPALEGQRRAWLSATRNRGLL